MRALRDAAVFAHLAVVVCVGVLIGAYRGTGSVKRHRTFFPGHFSFARRPLDWHGVRAVCWVCLSGLTGASTLVTALSQLR